MNEQVAHTVTTRKGHRLGQVGFWLSLLLFLGTTITLAIMVAMASPFTGPAIDSYDEHILEPTERATLNGTASTMGWIFLVGTVVGLAALALGIITARSSRLGQYTIILAIATPILALLISFWTLAAAASPDFIQGAEYLGAMPR